MSETATRQTWMICVRGYGSFEFVGSEAEAEEMRRHKARWEGAGARKHLATETCLMCRGEKRD